MAKGYNIDRLLDNLAPEERLNLFNKLAQIITDEEFAELADEQVMVVSALEVNEDGKSIADQGKELIHEPGKIYGLSSGFNDLDEITRGMAGGDLIIAGAETGVGKTLLFQNILHNLGDQGVPSFFVSLEMSNPQAYQRYVEMDMDYKGISKEEAEKRIDAMPLHYFDPGKRKVTTDNLRIAIAQAKEKHDIGIVLVDHIHYFARSQDNASGEIGYIVRELKLMARLFNIPILAISHLRKLSKPGMPNLNDLRDSSFIGQDADIVIMMTRKKFDEDPVERKKLIWSVQKNRPRSLVGSGMFMITDNFKLTEGQK